MSISLDHTAILGSTLEKIAFEKAGIVKAGGRLVLYPDQAPAVTQELEQICQERQVELFRPDLSQVEEGERSIGGTAFTVAGTRWGDVALRTPLFGGAPGEKRRHRPEGAGGAGRPRLARHSPGRGGRL